ncbi:MAG: purine-nucleoside phosphorylase [Chitinophagales bacterium]|nr:purine-nucleoside phosphorylase [Chitinophagales bacterium]
MATPHIEAQAGEIAESILLPGDPLRAKFIADNYLENAVQFNRVRNMFGYTGFYKGKRLSVMGTGMGMPSIGIYSYELIKFYGVKRLIRVGSAGSIQPEVKVKDVIIAQGASTNSSFSKQYRLRGEIAALSDYGLLSAAVSRAQELQFSYHVGNILSSDTFYDFENKSWKKWADMGVLGLEMEAYALFLTATALKAQALAICTISDSIITGESMGHEDREKSLRQMIELALDIA